jgi:hypothetical protein
MLTIVDCRHEGFKDLRCMSFTAKGDREILVAGVQDHMFKVDMEKGAVSETVRRYTETINEQTLTGHAL